MCYIWLILKYGYKLIHEQSCRYCFYSF